VKLSMKAVHFIPPAVALMLTCAVPLKEFYPDSYFVEDRVYQNRALRFTLTFRGDWNLMTSPNEMEGETREFARELQLRGAELLFAGSTVEGTQGVRGITIHLNDPVDEYAEKVRALNKDDVGEDFGLTASVLDGLPVVRWDYTVGEFRFVEFFFTLDTYNVRIAFWTRPDLFERFESVYVDIISSISYVGRY
jgi:hypothetical protein